MGSGFGGASTVEEACIEGDSEELAACAGRRMRGAGGVYVACVPGGMSPTREAFGTSENSDLILLSLRYTLVNRVEMKNVKTGMLDIEWLRMVSTSSCGTECKKRGTCVRWRSCGGCAIMVIFRSSLPMPLYA